MSSRLSVQQVSFHSPARASIASIRETVFVGEQEVPPELEFDGLDTCALHVLAYVDDQPVGTGRVLDDGHIGRVAVLKDFRGLGVGAGIVNALAEEAKGAGCERAYLGAQLQAVPFYRKLGYTPYGEEFMDAGIPHIHMEKWLK
ncbi:GNAT family N-acetyltransferase [Marinobacterium sp. AK62]|uniref:GNAT family N-acetyltransferase n=1 Tax=Marinobacterium alkalitolerans TaxID=1542925 RepID=A0ABS3ZEX3_9GAMM|nr:GNAT family N-acetyltransferase [Marinobacterium alkalitolerans]MBP0049875.1 GNAT family N-acetyltransferase [Marinobacterium alkalitolerans]